MRSRPPHLHRDSLLAAVERHDFGSEVGEAGKAGEDVGFWAFEAGMNAVSGEARIENPFGKCKFAEPAAGEPEAGQFDGFINF